MTVFHILSRRRHALADLNRTVSKFVLEEPVNILGLGQDALVADGLPIKDARIALLEDLRGNNLRRRTGVEVKR
jgi:hypothetical protein